MKCPLMRFSPAIMVHGFMIQAIIIASAATPAVFGFESLLEEDSKTEDAKIQKPLADEDRVAELLAQYEAALETELSTQLLAILEELQAFRNEEFLEVALDCLDYRATRKDKNAILELARKRRVKSREQLQELVEQEENRVRIEAARLLANFPEPKNAKQLLKRAQSRSLRERSELAGTFIEAVGWMKEPRSESEIYRLFKKSDNKHILQGCVRYFGAIPSRKFDIVRDIAIRMDPPDRPRTNDDQGDQNNLINLWRVQMDIFNFIKRDLSRTLTEITGEEFAPTDKGALAALKYIRDHRRRLRLR